MDRTACTANRHGNYSAYLRYRCRCADAREDWRLYYKRHREGRAVVRRVDATGTRRRIQALWAAGHTSKTIAAACGSMSAYEVQQVARQRTWLTPAKAAVFAAAYDALAGSLGMSELTRRRAGRAGYAPVGAWDDDTINDPAAVPNLGSSSSDTVVDEVAVERVHVGTLAFGKLTEAEQLELFRRYRHTGGRGTLCVRWNISTTTYRRLETAVAQLGGQVAA